MNELKLTLEITDQVQFWGANNEHYELVKAAFPKLKIEVLRKHGKLSILGFMKIITKYV